MGEKKGACAFVHLSRYTPNRKDAAEIKKAIFSGLPVRSKRYRDLATCLNGRRNAYSELLNDYLKDIGVSTYKTLDLAGKDKISVAFFLSQTLGFPHAAGLGRLHSRSAVDRSSDILKIMMDNLEVLGEWVVDCYENLFSQRFIRKFRPHPEYDIEKLKKALYNAADEVASLPGHFGKYVKSGYLTFFASGTLGSGRLPWLSCEVGFSFYLDRDKASRDQPLSLSMYAGFYGHHGIFAEAEKYDVKIFPTEDRAMKIFASLLENALAKARGQDVEGRHKALSSFQVPAA